jgi:hypothetical protein
LLCLPQGPLLLLGPPQLLMQARLLLRLLSGHL